MADNPPSTKLEEQIMNLNISDTPCSSEVISPHATINDDSNNDGIKNVTYNKSMVIETKIICSDNQKSECDIIPSKNNNLICNQNSLDHNDIVVKSDDNDSDCEDVDANNDTALLSDDNGLANIDDSNDPDLIVDDNDCEDVDANDDTALSSNDNGLANIDDSNDPGLIIDDNDCEDVDANDDTALSSNDNGLANIDDSNDPGYLIANITFLTDVISVKNIFNKHNTASLSDDNESDGEYIYDSDDDDVKFILLDTVNNDASSGNTIDNALPLMNDQFSALREKQQKFYLFMNLNTILQRFIHEPSAFDEHIEVYDKNEIHEIIDAKLINDKMFYLVDWKNWSRGFSTWERFGSLYKSQEHIFEYIKKKKFPDKIVNVINLMLNRQIITQLFEIFKSETGISLRVITLEEFCELFETHGRGSTFYQECHRMNIRSHLAILSLDFCRQHQEIKLKEWEIDINVIANNYNVRVENNIDLENPPNSFVYIPDYYIPEGEIIIPDNHPLGCLCTNDCSIYINCCKTLSGKVAYDSDRNVIVSPDCPIFECNKKCKCSSSCINRVVQHGSKVKFCIYKSKFPGWELKTYENIDKGQFVGIYGGEIITVKEYNQRLQNSSSSIDYTWKLDFNDTNNFKCIVDSTHYGNISRFINHSCEANLSIHSVWINYSDKYFPHLALFANRNILANEQLTTDYFISRDKDSLKKSGIKCQCQMKNCKGYYF